MTEVDPWTMWEARVADGRLPELLAWAHQHADRSAQLFSSAEPNARLVIITRQAELPEPPADLIARDPAAWVFHRVDRGLLDATARDQPGVVATPPAIDRV